MAALDPSVPEMNAAVAARDKARAIFFRDEVLRIREQMTGAFAVYTAHLEEHESVSN